MAIAPTWTQGNQQNITNYGLGNGLANIGAGQADCGQYAAGVGQGNYLVGSINPWTGVRQPLAARTPQDFDGAHAMTGTFFGALPIPAAAQGVAFIDRNAAHSFHYGRLLPGGAISMTDANQAAQPGMGGTFAAFDANMNARAQAGVQQIQHLANRAEFVRYCNDYYHPGRQEYYFVYFG
jgi:hypothetical protein